MPILTKNRRGELQVIVAALLIIILNSFVFAGLSLGSTRTVSDIIYSIAVNSTAYLVFIIVSIIFVIINKKEYLKLAVFGLLGFMTLHIIMNLYYLIIDPRINDNGVAILADASLIWIVSVLVFALWYWIVDRGGPISRETRSDETRYDLLFPQYQTPIKGWSDWMPKFLDYVFFSFFTSTGFSPADTLPLSKRVKTLMMVEATISLIIIGMVVSRATSIIK